MPHDGDHLLLAELVRKIAMRYGDLDVAGQAANAEASVCRDLADRIGTPETLRDLSISLDNVGAVAQARGDWDRATTVYDEALSLARAAAAADRSRTSLDWLAYLEANPPKQAGRS